MIRFTWPQSGLYYMQPVSRCANHIEACDWARVSRLTSGRLGNSIPRRFQTLSFGVRSYTTRTRQATYTESDVSKQRDPESTAPPPRQHCLLTAHCANQYWTQRQTFSGSNQSGFVESRVALAIH